MVKKLLFSDIIHIFGDMEAIFEDCTKCPFCLISKKTKEIAKVNCSYLDRIVSEVSLKEVLKGIAVAKLPEDCPYIIH